MGTNIYLQSDFIEYYDRYLHDPMGKYRFKRLSKSGRTRREIFSYLEGQCNKGVLDGEVIPYGTVKEIYEHYSASPFYSPSAKVVVHFDEKLHRGEGKELLGIEEAYKKCPDTLATIFIDRGEILPVTGRELIIGKRCFKLAYYSLTDWRSNCGEVFVIYYSEIKFENEEEINKCLLPYPIYSLDFIPFNGIKYYIDFNIAPGFDMDIWMPFDLEDPDRQTGKIHFSEIISGEEVAKEIENRIKNL